MNDQSRFRALFDSAIQDYERVTGYGLVNHHLTSVFEDCGHPVESVVAFIQGGRCAGNAIDIRIQKSLEGTVSVLYTLSNSTAFRNEATGLVRYIRGC
jgi:hypothetical protein